MPCARTALSVSAMSVAQNSVDMLSGEPQVHDKRVATRALEEGVELEQAKGGRRYAGVA